jgi:hypothetical protein
VHYYVFEIVADAIFEKVWKCLFVFLVECGLSLKEMFAESYDLFDLR